MTAAEVAGVVKADAYGTGMARVAKALAENGCKRFFVATPDEALVLRESLPDADIYCLGGLYPAAASLYAHHALTPVLNTEADIDLWRETAQKLSRSLPAALHVDTGMNRLGLRADAVSGPPDGIDTRVIISHFACSDEKAHPMNDAQAEAFARLAAKFPGALKSLSNSSGIFRNKEWHHDIVRPGYALYGGNPVPEAQNPLFPVITLKTRILQTRVVKKGESAGYGAHHVFEQDSLCAVAAIGYADGLLRSGSGRASLFWNGMPCPVRGRISMDLTIVEIGHLPVPPQQGDWLEVIGPHQTIDMLAAKSGTIGYEILTSLGHRYARVYED